MIETEQIKKYFWSLFGVVGIVAFWAGIWDGIGGLSYISSPLVSLIIGLTILIGARFIFKEFNPFAETEKSANKAILNLHKRPNKHEFQIKYHDRLQKNYQDISGKDLKDIEKLFLVVNQNDQQEVFIPVHRVKEIRHKGKLHWKAQK